MCNKKQSILLFSLVYLLYTTFASASMRTWSDHYSRSDDDNISSNNVYVGVRGYMSSMSTNSIQNNLKGKSFKKDFYRTYCVGANPSDKWLCGDILTTVPTSAPNGYEAVSPIIDLSNEKFSTQDMNYQLPGFSVVLGKTVLVDGFHAELEVGTSSSSSSNGGLFTGKRIVNIDALKGGSSLPAAPPALTGLDKYPIQLDSVFNAELSKSFLGFNLIYDIDISEIKPFVGVGVAYTIYTTMLNLNSSDQALNKGLFGDSFTDGKTINTQEHKFSRVTYSFLAGFAYPLSDMVTAEFGYKHTIGGNLDWNLVQGGKEGATGAQLPIMTVKNAVFQEFFLGLKYSF